jgi:hypothetical protein
VGVEKARDIVCVLTSVALLLFARHHTDLLLLEDGEETFFWDRTE